MCGQVAARASQAAHAARDDHDHAAAARDSGAWIACAARLRSQRTGRRSCRVARCCSGARSASARLRSARARRRMPRRWPLPRARDRRSRASYGAVAARDDQLRLNEEQREPERHGRAVQVEPPGQRRAVEPRRQVVSLRKARARRYGKTFLTEYWPLTPAASIVRSLRPGRRTFLERDRARSSSGEWLRIRRQR